MTHWLPARPTDGRAPTLALVAVPLALAGAYLGVHLIGNAWSACDEAEPPHYGALLFLYLPVMAGLMWIGFLAGIATLQSRTAIPRLLPGFAIAVVIALGTFVVSVPVYGEEAYLGSPISTDFPECGPDGIPTWWPAWLPS